MVVDTSAGKERKFMTPMNALEADIVVQARKGEKGHNILERFSITL